jgi:hypothetical protein
LISSIGLLSFFRHATKENSTKDFFDPGGIRSHDPKGDDATAATGLMTLLFVVDEKLCQDPPPQKKLSSKQLMLLCLSLC